MSSALSSAGGPGSARRVYLDSASGAALHPAAREAFGAALEAAYADPRQLHHSGRAGRLVLDNARAAKAEALGVRADEVFFTSSGTETVHRGLLGLRRAAARTGARIVLTTVEHSAVLHASAWSGAPTRAVAVDAVGRVRLDDLDLTDAAVVACQSANHEVGTLQPVEAVAERSGHVPVFVDACASAGRLASRMGGRRWRPRPTSGEALRASASSSYTAAHGGGTRSPGTTAREGARRASRTCRRTWQPPPFCRPSSRSARPRTCACTRPSAGSAASSAGCRTSRSSAPRATGSPTWSRSPASTSTARRS